mmetsp:Transcript_37922/g.109379  ORF Transcript_37922/g.109379 Transcript_37922/m.109379 type:complete len:1156 (+) Transcript_37922:69-3536(+)
MALVRALSSPVGLGLRNPEHSVDRSASRCSDATEMKASVLSSACRPQKPLQPRIQIQRPGLFHDPLEVPSPASLHKSSTSIWRAPGRLEQSTLPPLAKGASRHRVPSWAAETRVVVRAPGGVRPTSRASCDVELAESYGRRILGDSPWPQQVFKHADFGSSGYLSPAEWAAVTCRLKAELGTANGSFKYSFASADHSMDGRVDMEEWESFATLLEEVFGHRRCKVASMRYLGTRKAETRSRVKNIFMFDGYDQDASLRLLMACSKWSSSSLLDNVISALDAKADPNAGLADSRFNDYTPLIFLAMAQPTADGTQVALAIDTLVNARADVHRESGQMSFGKLLPLRFAARLQNRLGLEAILRHVDVGDRFNWAAGENVAHVMLDELRKLFGDTACLRIAARSRYSTQATVLLRLFASPIVGGKLTPEGAQKLLEGQFADGNIKLGSKADPDGPGLEGITALMDVVKKGDLDTTVALLRGKASPLQQDSSGATPLHFAAAQVLPDIARALLDAKAEPAMVDQAGFTAWMVAGEAVSEAASQTGDDGKQQSWSTRLKYDPSEYSELMELLKPRCSPDSLLDQASSAGWESLIGEEGTSIEALTKQLRLHESLFFDPRVIVRGVWEGRFPRKRLLMRVKDMLLDLLQTDPLKGDKKALTKYLLQATMGPTGAVQCGHVCTKWSTKDNRQAYRRELMEAVQGMLSKFAAECNGFRVEIERKAMIAKLGDTQAGLDERQEAAEGDMPASSGQGTASLRERAPGQLSGVATPASAVGDRSLASPPELALPQPVPGSAACLELINMPENKVDVPQSWQEEDAFWRAVQKRQVLRYDPPWARIVSSGACCSLQLLRLGAVTDLAECSALQQVHHSSMEEQLARGYVAYSELCNVAFQDRMKSVALRAAEREGLDVSPPDEVVPPKRLKRLMEKTREANSEHRDVRWPGLSEHYLRFSHCFHILDTVRTAFVCGGNTLAEQVACCMHVVKEFGECTAEKDGLCVVRRKSSYASGVKGSGGYADVKLLVYADLGVHKAFDDTEVPLRIVGEVQVILKKYMEVKKRMHLVYEVNRGSFDRLPLAEYKGDQSRETAHRAMRKLKMCRLNMLGGADVSKEHPSEIALSDAEGTAHDERAAAAEKAQRVDAAASAAVSAMQAIRRASLAW